MAERTYFANEEIYCPNCRKKVVPIKKLKETGSAGFIILFLLILIALGFQAAVGFIVIAAIFLGILTRV
ncbi:MAG: hypothetical protein KJ955_07445 [Nanoarchaeota archaeon]|nr:hypothetical protein [Nanoarchaeota archaeon]